MGTKESRWLGVADPLIQTLFRVAFGRLDGLDTTTAALGTGTVTSVALTMPVQFTVANSPVTTSGNLTVTWANETANRVFAGPSTGSPGIPAFRALVAADIPNLPASIITSGQLATAQGGTGLDGSAAANGKVLIGNGSGFTLTTLTAGAGISITNGAGSISIAASVSGTVTSVGLGLPAEFTVSGSPVTTSGTLTGAWSNQTGNVVFSSPSGGGSGAPAFRSLVAADIPSLDASKITSGQLAAAQGGTGLDTSAAANGKLLIGNGSGLSLTNLTQGSGVTITNGAGSIIIAATGTGGTVTSVGLSLPSELSVSGSPVTGSGTLSATWANASANQVFAGPTTGSATTPGFRALVAADIPNLAASIITGGTFAEARGGTNQSTYTLGDTLYASAANTLSKLAGNTTSTKKFLRQTGTGSVSAAPAWDTLVAGDIPSLDASKITSGQMATAQGGTGLDTSAAANGKVLIGNGSGLSLANISAGSNISVTNGAGSITIAATGVASTPTSVVGSDTSTTVTAGSDATINIAIGSGRVVAMAMLQGSTANGAAGVTVMATGTATDAKSMDASGAGGWNGGSTIMSPNAFGTTIRLKGAVISGSNLALTFHNNDVSNHTLSVNYTVFAW